MFRFLVLSSIVALATCRPGIIDSSGGLGSYGGGHSQSDLSLASISFAGASHGLGGGGASLGSEGYTIEGGHGGHEEAGGSGGGDYHHGVSIIGGGAQKPHTIDLTQGSGGNHGTFGGSFVASSKYSAGGHGGGSGHEGWGGHEGGGFEAHYSDVLGASGDSHSGGYESLGSSASFGH